MQTQLHLGIVWTEVSLCCSGMRPTVNTDIACLVSVGCGIFPAEPIGNTDIIEAFNPMKLTQMRSKLKSALTMLTTAVS